MSEAIFNLVTIVTSAVLLSMEYGWKVGVSIVLLVWFHKEMPR